MDSRNWFTNAVGLLHSRLAPADLLKRLHEIEQSQGRRRPVELNGYQDRPLDLDILLYGNRIINTKNLVLPHPRIHERLFVLEPLCEIAPPNLTHPFLAQTVQELLSRLRTANCGQRLHQRQWP